MDIKAKSVKKHIEWQGKIEVISRVEIADKNDLSVAYTPGVAEPCLEIEKNPSLSFSMTRRGNMVAVITNGTAVLGLGDIGAVPSMPVMEGKCALFKQFGGVDAFPICIDSKDVDEVVRTVELIAGSFGGINLEDIAAPDCFEIERRLKEKLDIPVFHDDQHGTAIIVGAALTNALKLAQKQLSEITVVINGPGAAGLAIGKLLLKMGVGNLLFCDQYGVLYSGCERNNSEQEAVSQKTNKTNLRGTLADALKGADVFIGVSRPNMVTSDMVKTMAEKPIIFALANPTPEIMPEEAIAGGAFIVGTGRSDYPNQINNLLAFPGIFKGALAVRAREINDEMKLAAVAKIANLVGENELQPDYILPSAFDPRVPDAVAQAVSETAVQMGLTRE